MKAVWEFLGIVALFLEELIFRYLHLMISSRNLEDILQLTSKFIPQPLSLNFELLARYYLLFQ